MCSRYMCQPTGLKDKQKIVKPKTTEKKNPPLFSQSWTGSPTKKTRGTQNKRSSNFKPDPSPQGHPRRPVQQHQFRGPNPSLPHLKYGLFKKGKNPNADSSEKVRRIPQEKKQKGEASESVYVMRHTERNTHRLSRAASTHLDIKPRAIK